MTFEIFIIFTVLSGKIERIEESTSPFKPRKLQVTIYSIYKQPDDEASKVKRSENLEVRIHDQWMKKEVRVGEEYLLAGALYNGRYIVTGCDWVQKMFLLSPVQRWGLKKYYQRNKECEVIVNQLFDLISLSRESLSYCIPHREASLGIISFWKQFTE